MENVEKVKILCIVRWGFNAETMAMFYRWFLEKDVDVFLYTMEESYRLHHKNSVSVCPFYIGTWTKTFYLDMNELKRVIRFYEPDIVVHGQETYRPQALMRAELLEKFNLPHVWLVSQNLLTQPETDAERDKEKKCIPLVDGFIACSESVKHRYETVGAKNIITSSVGGISEELFRPCKSKSELQYLKQFYDIPANKFMILYSGRIIKPKGIHIVIKAISELSSDIKQDIVFIITGSDYGGYSNELLKQAKELKIGDNIIFKGKLPLRKDIANMMRVADVFVYPSIPISGWVEQQGVSPIEASMSGTPCIVSNIGGLKDVVTQDTGFLITPEDYTAIADKIELLYNDKEIKNRLGNQAREYAISRYSEHHVATEQLEFVKNCLKTKRLSSKK